MSVPQNQSLEEAMQKGGVLVRGNIKTISVTKVCGSTGDYSAEDVISESSSTGTSFVFSNCARLPGEGGYITRAQVICETTAQTPRLTLYLFNAVPTSVLNDNAANTALKHADVGNYVGKIDFPALEDLGGDSEAVATPSTYGNLPLAFICSTIDTALYGVLVTRDAITGESAGDDYIVKLTIEQF